MVSSVDAFHRLAFCHSSLPNPPAGDVASIRLFSVVYFSFTVLGLINAVLDATEAIQRLPLGYTFVGSFILIGIAFARSLATLGYTMIHKHGGFPCVFFYQDAKEFMARFDKSQQRTVRSLFALFFTELAVFCFEDVLIIILWYSYGIYGTNEGLFLLNFWTTLIAAIARGLLLTGLLILSVVFWTWKNTCGDVVLQIIAALIFLALLFSVSYVVLFLVVGFTDISREPNEQSDSSYLTDVVYFLYLIASWTFSSFLSCYLLAKSRNFDPFHEVQMIRMNQSHLEMIAAADIVAGEVSEGPVDVPLVAALPIETRAENKTETETPAIVIDP